MQGILRVMVCILKYITHEKLFKNQKYQVTTVLQMHRNLNFITNVMISCRLLWNEK